jgi:hypothetical protein
LRRFLFGLFATLAFAAPRIAVAASPADVATADALFREARAAAKRGDHATACPKFRESYRLDKAVGTLLNVADCDEYDGHLVDALGRFEEALGRLAPSDDRLTYVRSRIHALGERIPHIVGTLGSSAERIHVLVDGAEVATSTHPFVTRLDPGVHEVKVVGSGRDERLELLLKEGESKEIDFGRSIAPPPPPPTETTTKTAPSRSPERNGTSTLGLAVGGAGLVGLAASGVAVALMFDQKKTADAHCNGSECDQAGIDATAAGKRFGFIGGATFAVSAIAVGVGTFLFFHGRALAKDATISLGPSVTPNGGGFVIGGAL